MAPGAQVAFVDVGYTYSNGSGDAELNFEAFTRLTDMYDYVAQVRTRGRPGGQTLLAAQRGLQRQIWPGSVPREQQRSEGCDCVAQRQRRRLHLGTHAGVPALQASRHLLNPECRV